MKDIWKPGTHFFLQLALLFVISSCADAVSINPETVGDPAGFWKGIWHCIIMLFSFAISLFKDDVAIYAANNTGGWYDFGYLIGVMIFFGGSGNRTCR